MSELISGPRFAPVVSVVVVHWNTPDLLRTCLEAIGPAAAGVPYEIVVVDNGSRPGARADVKIKRGLHLVVNERNRGFAAAANQGAALARGEHLLFLNTDARLSPASLAQLVTVLGRDGCIGAVAPLGLDEHGAPRFPGMRFLTPWNHALGLLGLRGRRVLTRRGLTGAGGAVGPAAAVSVDWARASVLLVRTTLFRALGGFDEGFFFYEEDEDFCWRARRRGYEIAVACGVTVKDPGGGSTALAGAWPAVELYRSQLRFVRRRAGAAAALAYRFNVTVVLLAKAAVAAVVRVGRRTNVRRPRAVTRKVLRSLWTGSRETWSLRA